MRTLTFGLLTFLLTLNTAFAADLDLPNSPVTNMAIDPSSNVMAVVHKDLSMRIWSIPEGQLIASTQTNSEVSDISFSGDGSYIFAASNSGKLQVWNTSTGRQVNSYSSSYDYDKTCVDLSPDQSKLAFGERMFRVSILDLATKETKTIKTGDVFEYINFLRYGKEGRFIYVGCSQTVIKINSSNLTRTNHKVFKAHMNKLEISEDGKNLVLTSYEKEMAILDPESMQVKHLLKFDSYVVDLSVGTNRAVVTFLDGSLALIDLARGGIIKRSGPSYFNGCNIKAQISKDDKYIYAGNKNGEVQVWSTNPLQVDHIFSSAYARINGAGVNASGDLMAVNYSNGLVKVFSMSDLQEQKIIDQSLGPFRGIDFHSSRDELMLVNVRNEVLIIDARSGQVKNKVATGNESALSARYLEDKILVLSDDHVKVFDANFGLPRRINTEGKFNRLDVNPNGSKFALLSQRSLKVFDLSQKKFIYEKTITGFDSFTSASFSAVHALLAYSTMNENSVVLVNYNTGEVYAQPQFRNLPMQKGKYEITPFGVMTARFDADGNLMVGANSNIAYKYNVLTGKTYTLNGIKCRMTDYVNNANNKSQLFVCGNGEIVLRRNRSKQPYLTLLSGNADEHCWFLPNHKYYWSTKKMANNIRYFSSGIQEPFSSMDGYRNVPDTILSTLDSEHSEIGYYKRLRSKRFSLSKKELQMNDAGSTKILNQSIPLVIEDDNINLKLVLNGKNGAKPKYLEVRVNGVLIVNKLLDNFNEEIQVAQTIQLASGKNLIECKFKSDKATWSTPSKQLFVISKPKIKTKSTLHFIGIGTTIYKAGDTLANGRKDITDLISMFRQRKDVLGYEELKIDTVLGKNVDKKAVQEMISAKNDVGSNDLVFVYYSGHGLFDDNKDYYLSTYDFDFDNPSKAGFTVDYLDKLCSTMPAQNKVIFVNACHSGEFDEDLKLLHDVRNQFVDIRSNTGSFVVSSANANQFSSANSSRIKSGNTVFGYALIKTLKDNSELNVQEIGPKLNKVVKKYSRRQNSSFRQFNYLNDFRIW